MDVDKDSDKNSDLQPHDTTAYVFKGGLLNMKQVPKSHADLNSKKPGA